MEELSVTDFAKNYYTKIYYNEVEPRLAHLSFEELYNYVISFRKKTDDIASVMIESIMNKRESILLLSQIEDLFKLEVEFRAKVKDYPPDNLRLLLGITKVHDELLSSIRVTYLQILPDFVSRIEGIKKKEIDQELKVESFKNLQIFSSSYEVTVDPTQLNIILVNG